MKNFQKSLIINYPINTNRRWFSQDINLSNFASHLTKSSNYSSVVNSYLHEGEYWQIKNSSDFNNLRDDIENISRQKRFRTLEEFTYLLSFIFEEKIKFFIGRDIKPERDNYAALFYAKHNSIVINSEYLRDVDEMCASLTHELIHYLQFNGTQFIPLNIDIEDAILTGEYLSYYDNYYGEENNVGDILKIELEAKTFEYFPNFIRKYKQNKNQFLISPERTLTIKWICDNKKIPKYSSQSSTTTQNQPMQIDFETGEIVGIKSIKNDVSEASNQRFQSINYFYEEALKYFQIEEYNKAIDFFNSGIDSKEFNTWTKKEQGELFNNRAMSFYYIGKYGSAYDDLTQVISLFSSKRKDLNLYWIRAKCSYYLKEYANSITDLDYLIKLNQDPYFYFYRGLSKKFLGDSTSIYNRTSFTDVKVDISSAKSLYEDAVRDSEFAIKNFKNETVTREENKIEEFEDLRSSILEAIVKLKNKTRKKTSHRKNTSQSKNTSKSKNFFRVDKSYQENNSGCANFLLGAFLVFLCIAVPPIGIFALIYFVWKNFDDKNTFKKR